MRSHKDRSGHIRFGALKHQQLVVRLLDHAQQQAEVLFAMLNRVTT